MSWALLTRGWLSLQIISSTASRTWRVLVLIEEDIKLSIVETKSSEVVMTWMAKVQGEEVVLSAEVLEKVRSYCIFRITVSITSYIDWTLVSRGCFFQEEIKEGESRHKLRISSRCWKVECNVD